MNIYLERIDSEETWEDAALRTLSAIANALAPLTESGNPPSVDRLPEFVRRAMDWGLAGENEVNALSVEMNDYKRQLDGLKDHADAVIGIVNALSANSILLREDTPRLQQAITAYKEYVLTLPPLDEGSEATDGS